MSICFACVHEDVCGKMFNKDCSDVDSCDYFLQILYLCDQRDKCDSCYSECKLTRDITHAKNFKRSIIPSRNCFEEVDMFERFEAKLLDLSSYKIESKE